MNIKMFEGKVCWITGASSGIGAALAVALNQLGATIIISARNLDNLEQVKRNCPEPGKVFIAVCDMEDLPTLPEIATALWEKNNGIDYVFLNAGFALRDMVVDTDFELIRKQLTINFLSAVSITKSLLPLMINKGSGCFVVTSSLSGKYGIPKLAAYAASKHALHGFYESLRAEHEKDGIKISILIPGLVKTNISVNSLKGDGTRYGKMQEAIASGISPEACAAGMIRAVAQGKKEALIGSAETYSVLVKRLFPGFFSYAISNHPLARLRKLGLFGKGS